MKKSDQTYLAPIARWSRMECEGIICLSATVTVDELANENVGAEEGSYLEGPIVF